MGSDEAALELASDLLMPPPPAIGGDEAARIVAALYGIAGSATPLPSERDRVFRIDGDDGISRLFRLANPAEDPAVGSFQTEALEHLRRVAPELPVQRMIPMRDGRLEAKVAVAAGVECCARMLSYLPGQPLRGVPYSERHAAQVGRLAAELARALRGFFHPAAGYRLYWDIKHAHRLRGFIPFIQDAGLARLVTMALDAFERDVLPRIPSLRAQVLHDDLHSGNLLVAQDDPTRVVGVLDFGDMVHTAVVSDLGVAAAFQVNLEGDALADVCRLVAAYHAVSPLEPLEIDLLPGLMAARNCIGVLVEAWRNRQSHEYERPAIYSRAALARLALIPAEEAKARLRRACSMETAS